MGRPELKKVGVQFVPDVKPYEKMKKLRLLNAGHFCFGLLGALTWATKPLMLYGKTKPLFTYLRTFLDKEATPVLDEDKGLI